MTRTFQRALVLVGVAIVLLVALSYYQSARATCVTETTGPFFAHTARGLSEALAGAGDTDELQALLDRDADRLDTLADRCRWPW